MTKVVIISEVPSGCLIFLSFENNKLKKEVTGMESAPKI